MLGGRIGVLTNYPYRVTIVTITTSEPDFGRHDLRHSADREIERVSLNRLVPAKSAAVSAKLCGPTLEVQV